MWEEGPLRGGGYMIFVTVGTHSQPFDRLVKAMDILAIDNPEEIIIQYGASTYVPEHATKIQWGSGVAIEDLIDKSRVIVGHTGSGTIINAVLKEKPLVLVPRLKQFGEHIDDHQKQLARIYAEKGRAIVVYNVTPELMKEGIEKACELDLRVPKDNKLIRTLHQIILDWDISRD
jgi:beta-1,4-N-acetylglucosaminyltransferase